jgi:hypothetical protein
VFGDYQARVTLTPGSDCETKMATGVLNLSVVAHAVDVDKIDCKVASRDRDALAHNFVVHL